MKKILVICFAVLSLNQYVNAQMKILFDATKAETAGNADWVIDADSHNLYYSSDAKLGGQESNAQQIPSPSQADIVTSTTQDYWQGGLSAWGIDAVKSGYYVETLPYDGKITYGDSNNLQDLSNYKIFVVCEPNILFTSDEKTAILKFVKNGGGLFMISDHNQSDRNHSGSDSPHIWNDLMQNNSIQKNPFGMTFDYDKFDESNGDAANLPNDSLLHGAYGDVSLVQFFGGTSITLNSDDNQTVTGVLYRNGYYSGNKNVLAAYARYGKGKVVAIGDSSPADDGSGDTNDNLYDGWIDDANGNHERFFMNATIWLATDNATSINTLAQDAHIPIFVNNNQLFVQSKDVKQFDLKIINIVGQVIMEKTIHSNKEIDLQLKYSGIYFYQLSYKDTLIKTGKFIINNN